jgi:hypothetical protein
MNRIKQFIAIYDAYRLTHSRRYALRIAFGCVFRGLPF